MALKDSLLFIHLPKTAGTSFRMSGLEYFGANHCIYDYGSGTSETSEVIQKLVYDKPDMYSLEHHLKKSDIKFLSGHVPMKKYTGIFALNNVVSFLRNPLDQFFSHFSHKVRHHGYEGDLQTMLDHPAMPDLQARNLAGTPIEAYGFIGITERYSDSLKVFNKYFNTEFKYTELNKNPQKKREKYALPTEMLDVFNQRAKASNILYTKANFLLDQHLKAIDDGYEFTHAGISELTQSHISGFAFNVNRVRPVKLQLLVNDKIKKLTTAIEDRPLMRSMNSARNGYVGFNFNISKSLKKGDHLSISVATTGQIIFEKIIV